jgi:2-iminobutanoate/2-iminopropanoate deaminase
MTIKRTASGTGLPSGFPFSLAAEAGGICFVSGMPPLGPDGRFVAGTFEEEVDLAWKNVVAILANAELEPADVIYVQCVLSDMDNYGAINEWWRRVFPDVAAAPARFTYQAGALPFGAKIELQAVAARRA